MSLASLFYSTRRIKSQVRGNTQNIRCSRKTRIPRILINNWTLCLKNQPYRWQRQTVSTNFIRTRCINWRGTLIGHKKSTKSRWTSFKRQRNHFHLTKSTIRLWREQRLSWRRERKGNRKSHKKHKWIRSTGSARSMYRGMFGRTTKLWALGRKGKIVKCIGMTLKRIKI